MVASLDRVQTEDMDMQKYNYGFALLSMCSEQDRKKHKSIGRRAKHLEVLRNVLAPVLDALLDSSSILYTPQTCDTVHPFSWRGQCHSAPYYVCSCGSSSPSPSAQPHTYIFTPSSTAALSQARTSHLSQHLWTLCDNMRVGIKVICASPNL
jgi:hypothetical protein